MSATTTECKFEMAPLFDGAEHSSEIEAKFRDECEVCKIGGELSATTEVSFWIRSDMLACGIPTWITIHCGNAEFGYRIDLNRCEKKGTAERLVYTIEHTG